MRLVFTIFAAVLLPISKRYLRDFICLCFLGMCYCVYDDRYRALYNYKPRNEDELELTEGDVVEVMEQCEDGWFVGLSTATNEFGTFPGNYVELVW